MRSRRSSRTQLLMEGAAAGALLGAVEARWALPPLERPLLGMGEWWTAWGVSVLLIALWGLVAAFVLSLLARRATERVHGLAVGLAVAPWLAAGLFLRLRPLLGPDGRAPALLAAGGALLAALLLCMLLGARRRAVLTVLAAIALLATADGARLALRAPGDVPAQTQRTNLLLLTLDTTRSDHLPPGAAFLDADGFLRGLDSTAVRLDQVTAPVPLTGPSHASLLTGLPPLDHGALDNGWPIDPQVETLAESLRERGYATGAVLSAAVLHRDLCGLDEGFAEYDDTFRPGRPLRRLAPVALAERAAQWMARRAQGLSHQRRAGETVGLGLRFLDRHAGEPFFLWLHFYDPHAPYEPVLAPPLARDLPDVPGAFDRAEDPVWWEKRRAYAGEIRAVDAALDRLADGLRARGLDEETLVVVVTDHGEDFGTHGRGYRFDHGAYLFDDCVHLGAWWKEPDAAVGGTSRAPLAMDGLGRSLRRRMLSDQRLPWRGESQDATYFHSTLAADTLWFGLRRPTRKLLVGRTPSTALVWEAYDLVADPGELHSLLPDRLPPSQQVGETLAGVPLASWRRDEAALLEWAARVQMGLQQPRPILSDEARERLRTLGYIR